MDVTERNFTAALDILRLHLPDTAFASFDLEFSGLGTERPSPLDTPAIRYETAVRDATQHAPLQFGLSLFKEREEGSVKEWHVISFNFNLYPRAVYYPERSRYPLYDRFVNMQSSSVKFLMEHGFNFDKCLRGGVSWLSKELEQAFLQHVIQDMKRRRNKPSATHKDLSVTKEQRKELDRIDDIIRTWKEKQSSAEQAAREDDAMVPKTIISLPGPPRERKQVFDMIRDKHDTVFAKARVTQQGLRLLVELYDDAGKAKAKYEEQLVQDAQELVSRATAFRYVIDSLVSSQIPLVVHNGLMDITKVYANYIAPLPPTLEEFKQGLRENFGVVYDTAWMAELLCRDIDGLRGELGKIRGISEMLKAVKKHAAKKELVTGDIRSYIPVCTRREKNGTDEDLGFLVRGEQDEAEKDVFGFGGYAREGEYEHEAGYDALETGRLFVAMREFGVMERAKNKIFVGSCGGYMRIDVEGGTADVNEWFDRDVVVVKGMEGGEGGGQRFRKCVHSLVRGSGFDGARSAILSAGDDVFVVVFEKKKKVKAEVEQMEVDKGTGLERVFANGQEMGLEVVRYGRSALGMGWGSKRRRLA